MYLVATGLNHKTAPVALRETVSLDGEECIRLLEAMRAGGVSEGAILSTCNRTEVYVVAPSPEGARSAAFALFERLAPPPYRSAVADSLYSFEGREAARHLFTVASGCDSLVIGEAQVLGQVREALKRAGRAASAGPYISTLFNQAIRTGKRVRTETPIGQGATSVSHAAVQLARELFATLSETAVLLIGAGKMAEVAAKNLITHGVGQLLVANRTPARAERLARSIGGEAVPLESVEELLAEVDVVIASTGSKAPVITNAAVRQGMRRRGGRPLFLIDIAVPRDVEPGVQSIDGVVLYNVDDLHSVVEANLAERRQYLPQAQAIVDEEVGRFEGWMNERKAAPVIRALRSHVLGTVDRELERTLRKLAHLSEREKEQIRSLAHAIAGKILHTPTIKLKAAVDEGTDAELFALVAELFSLDLPTAGPRGEEVVPLFGVEEGVAIL